MVWSVEEDFSSTSQDSGKENRRFSTMTTPTTGLKKRSAHASANVLNPMFNSFPDPLRCHPPDHLRELQFHEVTAIIPDYNAFRRREDVPKFANRRLSFSGVVSSAANQGPTIPLSRTDPMVPQPAAVGIALTPISNNRVSYTGDFIKEAGKSGKDPKELVLKSINIKPIKQFEKVDSAVDPESRPATTDSGTSSRGAGSRVHVWDNPPAPIVKVLLLLAWHCI